MVTLYSAPLARLIALDAAVQPDDYLLVGDTCTIGRSSLCKIVVRRNTVSRLHAKIEQHGAVYVLTDVGSANGTFVNGRQISAPHPLHNNDLIGISDALSAIRFLIVCSDEPA